MKLVAVLTMVLCTSASMAWNVPRAHSDLVSPEQLTETVTQTTNIINARQTKTKDWPSIASNLASCEKKLEKVPKTEPLSKANAYVLLKSLANIHYVILDNRSVDPSLGAINIPEKEVKALAKTWEPFYEGIQRVWKEAKEQPAGSLNVRYYNEIADTKTRMVNKIEAREKKD